MTELKAAIAALSRSEQEELTAFLFHLRHRAEPDYIAAMERRMNDNNLSHWLTPEEFKRRLDAR